LPFRRFLSPAISCTLLLPSPVRSRRQRRCYAPVRAEEGCRFTRRHDVASAFAADYASAAAPMRASRRQRRMPRSVSSTDAALPAAPLSIAATLSFFFRFLRRRFHFSLMSDASFADAVFDYFHASRLVFIDYFDMLDTLIFAHFAMIDAITAFSIFTLPRCRHCRHATPFRFSIRHFMLPPAARWRRRPPCRLISLRRFSILLSSPLIFLSIIDFHCFISLPFH
jgi:hypothetical protein